MNTEKKEEEKKKTTDWPTFHRVLLRKSGEYLFSISFMYLMFVSGLKHTFFMRLFFTVGFR